MPLPRSSHRSAMAVTDWRAATSRPSVAPRTGRDKSWVLAMLALKRGLRVAPVPPQAADLTQPERGRRNDAKSGRRNRRFNRTKERSRTSVWPCRLDHTSLTVGRPMVGETELRLTHRNSDTSEDASSDGVCSARAGANASRQVATRAARPVLWRTVIAFVLPLAGFAHIVGPST